MEKKKVDLHGIKGWLLFPTVGLVSTSLISLLNIITFIFNPSESLSQAVIIISIITAIFSSLALVLEFKLDPLFPATAIVSLWIGCITTLWVSTLDKDYIKALVSFAVAVIWSYYFISSKRVRHTFKGKIDIPPQKKLAIKGKNKK
jgi:hypothetical protein